MTDSEGDTCRKLAVPKHRAAGPDDEPHSIAEQTVMAYIDALHAADAHDPTLLIVFARL